jgi:sugar phosphate isomerase/epimerase
MPTSLSRDPTGREAVVPVPGKPALPATGAVGGFHLDSGHSKLERDYDRWDEYLDRLGGRLLHVHLSDNDGTADQHLPLGAVPRSTTDWPEHVRKLKASDYNGTITLEVFAPEPQYLLSSRDLLRRWWDEA